ncbi:unnamed protein product [Chrysoparadoxa australica]
MASGQAQDDLTNSEQLEHHQRLLRGSPSTPLLEGLENLPGRDARAGEGLTLEVPSFWDFDCDSSGTTTQQDDDLDGGSCTSDSSSDEDTIAPVPGAVKLQPSLFRDRPPTVFFDYPKELNMTRAAEGSVTEPLGPRKLRFKTYWERNSVKNAFLGAGFIRTKSASSWTACWGKHPSPEGFRALNRFQKVNHFPGSWCIGRKDRLMRTLFKMKRLHWPSHSQGEENPFDFLPEGYMLPADKRQWLKAADADPRALWITKPPASSCGRGIKIVPRGGASNVKGSKKAIVQRYVHNPMLINHRKFDLRLYVLVTSMEPLRVYLFEEGLVRFSSKPYTLKNLKSNFIHLTNYSINKKAKSYNCTESMDPDNPDLNANKWALSVFWKYLQRTYGEAKANAVKRAISDIIVKTIIAADAEMTVGVQQQVKHRGSCFELFGFDVLLDDRLKPWLLEVNVSPSLFGGSALDKRIKGTLMTDIFHLVGFRPFDAAALVREERRQRKSVPGMHRPNKPAGGRRQDAWRRHPCPESISLAQLGEEEWEVVRETEDELNRCGHFQVLFPTKESVQRMWHLFSTPRFLNGVIGRWLLTGGLRSSRNRALIGVEEGDYRRASGAEKEEKGATARGASYAPVHWERAGSNATTLTPRAASTAASEDTASSYRSQQPSSGFKLNSKAKLILSAKLRAKVPVAAGAAKPLPIGRKEAGQVLGPLTLPFSKEEIFKVGKSSPRPPSRPLPVEVPTSPVKSSRITNLAKIKPAVISPRPFSASQEHKNENGKAGNKLLRTSTFDLHSALQGNRLVPAKEVRRGAVALSLRKTACFPDQLASKGRPSSATNAKCPPKGSLQALAPATAAPACG